ncbi:MAG: NAD-dependent epimerase/dehydratase family protein [Spirochaetaceae bacterium]|nr:NAD-dependent epimerase/dehydratase family protein [Spirochaetaceae bacterium]
MELLESKLYQNDIEYITSLKLPWNKLQNKTVLISGASGMIGSCIIDALLSKDINVKVIALGRNEKKARDRFNEYWDLNNFKFLKCDINDSIKEMGNVDFVIHAASNTHPIQYATDPIGTVTTNIIGTNNLLKYATNHKTERFLFASSVEVYGENRGDVEKFKEDYCGYIDCNTLRAGYPESKRAGETLCQAFIKQNDLDIVIPRLSRTYGPTMLMSDSKAIAQFIKKGLLKEDIILKSQGTQFYSYTYVVDAVTALLTILLKGVCGEAYNISDDNSNVLLKNLAEIIADYTGKNVVFELPDEIELAGYSKATKAILDSKKLQSLGWKSHYDITSGLRRTIEILSYNH